MKRRRHTSPSLIVGMAKINRRYGDQLQGHRFELGLFILSSTGKCVDLAFDNRNNYCSFTVPINEEKILLCIRYRGAWYHRAYRNWRELLGTWDVMSKRRVIVEKTGFYV